MLPFPWKGCQRTQDPPRFEDKSAAMGDKEEPKAKRMKTCRSSVVDHTLPWYSELGPPCEQLPICFRVPNVESPAGTVLKHSLRILDSIFEQHDPCIFKIGFTHNPAWRWSNRLYGYAGDRDKWSSMTILYISNEPFGPAMLEAALINKHCSASALHICLRSFKFP